MRKSAICAVIFMLFACLLGFGTAYGETDVRYVVPCGQTIGVSLDLSGVYVDDIGSFRCCDGAEVSPAKAAGIKSGDYITAVNNTDVKTVDELKAELAKHENGEDVAVCIKTGTDNTVEKTVTLTVYADQSDGVNKIGVWVKDAASGVGTITYYDQALGEFAAIGHSISNTGVLGISGDVYKAEVAGVRKSESGTPGELIGVYSENKLKIGSVSGSSDSGIIGRVTNPENLMTMHEAIAVGTPDDAVLGEAEIYCCIESTKIESFAIEICEVNQDNDPDSSDGKDIIFRVTDDRLLQKTGGIVRGMSGSPIIQCDKLIGAVTHVMVNDPTMGYGIFIENMGA